MKKLFLSVFLIIIGAQIKAQVVDNFTDGEFTTNPVWNGDDSLWQVNSNLELQSKGTTGTAKDICLVTQNASISNKEWRFKIRFNFSPSTQNFCRFYLTSNQINLNSNLNGYYIQFGGSTGSTDTISLYKQIGSSRIRIIAGRPATVVKTNNIVSIKVNKDSLGNWILFSDTLGNDNFITEGNVFDTTFNTSLYSGIMAKFTSSNIANFYLDDVYIGNPIIDSEPPKIESFVLLNDSILQLHFNEKILETEATNLTNFVLNNSLPVIVNIAVGIDGKSLLLYCNFSFVSAFNYNLLVKNITDLNNNKMADTSISFVFYNPKLHDIVINEIMPDPSPSNGLPDAEFIELYNRSNFDINIGGWKLSDLTGVATIPNYLLKANDYVIITSTSNENLFKPYGNTLAVPFLQGLNNDGDLVKLTDPKGKTIDEIAYNLTWYNNSSKKDGGWSLELINPFTMCKGVDNWLVSESPTGGTPGKVNFFNSNQPDTDKPVIKNWYYTNEQKIVLVFNEKMDVNNLQTLKISISGNSVTNKSIQGIKLDSISIDLLNPMVNNQDYTLLVDSVFDCSGNKINDNTTISFKYIPILNPKQNDVIITEISANPLPNTSLPDAEYIELYNRSSNIISLNNYKIVSGSSITAIGNYLLYPDSFIVLCDDSKLTAFSAFKNVITVPSLPLLSADDEIILLNEKNNIIHQINYKQDWYNNNVKASGGWSLEMIDTKNPCGTASNWTASRNTIGGTIGFKNSVEGISIDKTNPILSRIYPVNANSIELYFNETIDSLSIQKSNCFNINPPLVGNFEYSFKDKFFTQLTLNFIDSFKYNTSYKIKVDSVIDCANNLINEDNELIFGLSQQADTTNIAINEILFNPFPNGVDFVEIYNKTNQFIDIKNLWIGNRNSTGLIDNFYQLAPSGYMLLPQNYYVITTNDIAIKNQYLVKNNKNFIVVNTLPSFNDDEGNCVLFSKPETIFDELKYNEKMHFTLIDNKEGISLERIDFNKPTNNNNNWTSAASTSGFATPTYKNSQYLNLNIGNQILNIEPEVFTPNNDGLNDIVNISYKMNKNNFTATLNIYNSSGVLVKNLLNNTPLGTEGIITWNGLSNTNNALPIGIYIINFDLFNTDGTTENIKKTIVIGSSY